MKMGEDQIFLAAYETAKIVLSFADSPKPLGDKCWLEDRRDRKVKPSTHQTDGGLCLEFRTGQYSSTRPGHPHALWTPWGKWMPWGEGGNWGLVMNDLLRRFKATQYLGPFGSIIRPVFVLTEVGNVVLPHTKLLPPAQFREDRLEAWNALLAKHQSSLEIP